MNDIPKWISVFDRLPDTSKRYLCVVLDGEMHYVAIHNWNGEEWCAPNVSSPIQKPVAFWQELPETWMLKFGGENEFWVDIENRYRAQLWRQTRVFNKPPQPPTASDECREAFEKEFAKSPLDKFLSGNYMYERVQCAWAGWQAAWNRRAPAPAAPQPTAAAPSPPSDSHWRQAVQDWVDFTERDGRHPIADWFERRVKELAAKETTTAPVSSSPT